MTWALLILAAGAATALLWFTCSRLDRTTAVLAAHYGVPDIVRGAVITAASSSAPELATVLLALLAHGEPELGLSVILGSALFNVAVIPAWSALAGGQPVTIPRPIIFKEGQFYLASVFLILTLVAVAALQYPVVGDPVVAAGYLTRGMAVAALGFYVFYIFLQLEDVRDHEPAASPSGSIGHRWATLTAGIIGIVIAAEVLIRVAIRAGELWHIPPFVWGATLIAAATSVPDLFLSIRAAQAERFGACFANALGSNTFDLLVVVPVSVLVAGATAVSFDALAPLFVAVIAVTIVSLGIMRRGLSLSSLGSWAMIGAYLLALVGIVAVATGS